MAQRAKARVHPDLIARARDLRRHPPDAEATLWRCLRRSALGARFRRQHPVLGYVADFCCLRRRLIVEIDGGQHHDGSQPIADHHRTAELERAGFRVLRFTNAQVLAKTEAVVEAIREHL